MDRIYDSGTSASPPAMPASPSNGYPIKGNPSTGQPATKPGPYWYHAVTEELLAVQALAGLPNSGSTLNQVATAIATLQRQQTNTAYTTGGTAPAFTVTLPASAVALAALGANLRLRLKFHSAGVGSDTLAIGSLAAKSLKQYDSTGAKVGSVIAAGQLVDVEYDGVDFVLLDPLPSDQAGDIRFFARSTAPTGFIKANGAAISRTAYPSLWAVAQASGMMASSAADWATNPAKYFTGDGVATFNIPDLRGEFLRGFDDGRGVDSGRVVGSAQAATSVGNYAHADASGAGATAAISIALQNADGGGPTISGPNSTYYMAASSVSNGGSAYSGSVTIRPRNVALLACIKY